MMAEFNLQSSEIPKFTCGGGTGGSESRYQRHLSLPESFMRMRPLPASSPPGCSTIQTTSLMWPTDAN